MGDVRPSALEVSDGARTFTAHLAVCVRADTGTPWGAFIGPADRRAETLLHALCSLPAPGGPPQRVLPGKLVLFDPALADEVRAALGRPDVEVAVSPPFEPFDRLFTELVKQFNDELAPTLDLRNDVIALLCAASARLWRCKPWQFVCEEPLIELKPLRDDLPPLYASVLGAGQDVFGVALYATIEDFERDQQLGARLEEARRHADFDERVAELEAEYLSNVRGRVFLVSFDPKEELPPAYVDKLIRNTWPRRFGVAPTFVVRGGATGNGALTNEEGWAIALAIEALVAFCERNEDALADEEMPLQDVVQVEQSGQTIAVQVRTPPHEQWPAPATTIYRFKVSLCYDQDIWRRIEVRSDQTLEDLHHAIQQAFGWDNDHLYAFFLSGKAWDTATEYTCPFRGRAPGRRTTRVRLSRLNLHPRQRILYIFDFGDEWRHDVRLERMNLQPDGGAYPRIIDAHGSPPPQYPDHDDEWDDEKDEADDEDKEGEDAADDAR
jgi:hypothetical protein